MWCRPGLCRPGSSRRRRFCATVKCQRRGWPPVRGMTYTSVGPSYLAETRWTCRRGMAGFSSPPDAWSAGWPGRPRAGRPQVALGDKHDGVAVDCRLAEVTRIGGPRRRHSAATPGKKCPGHTESVGYPKAEPFATRITAATIIRVNIISSPNIAPAHTQVERSTHSCLRMRVLVPSHST